MVFAAQLRPPPKPAPLPSDDKPLELRLEPIASVPAIVRDHPAPALFQDEEEEIEDEPAIAEPVKVAPKSVVRKPPPEPRGAGGYRLPDLSLFDVPQNEKVDESSRSHVLEDTLASFGVGAKVVHIERGPSITRYELKPERGVKISRIASLADDLALALAATAVRIEAPIPGKSAIGIEVPNKTVSIVAIREILEELPDRGKVPPLWRALGKDI